MVAPHMIRFLLVLTALVFSVNNWAQLLGPGVYCITASGPVRLHALPIPAQSTESFAEFLAADDRFVLQYRWDAATSPVQIAERRPTFRINEGYSPDRALQIVQIVKLEQKGSSRAAALHLGHDLPTQFRDGVLISLSRGPDGDLQVRPEADLAPGEYMLSLGPQSMQYDFSVR